MNTRLSQPNPCPICREEHKKRGLSFDGKGINSCGMHKERIVTIPAEYKFIGPILAAAPELLELMQEMASTWKDGMTCYFAPGCRFSQKVLQVIAKAKGGN